MGRIANILTAFILMVAVTAVCVFAALVISPDMMNNILQVEPTSPPITIAPPTAVSVAVVPTVTPTPTEDPLQPTYTPAVPPTPANLEPAPLPTLRPTLTPSITPIIPTRTPTRTPTATPTATVTPGPSPTATFTLSPFPFTKSSDSPIYLRNYANSAGCDWMGIAGEVLDTSGNPVADGQYRVHVWDSGIDSRVGTGTAKAYAPSGWEQFVLGEVAVRSYNVQLETNNGTAVSQVYRVQTRASCNENLLYFIFTQNR
jgi:hypothetical protein